MNTMNFRQRPLGFTLLTVALGCFGLAVPAQDNGDPEEQEYTMEFPLERCYFLPYGRNPYFLLQPGHRLVLEGEDEGVQERVAIRVLPRIKTIRLDGIGLVQTRVIEEREWKDGVLVEVSKNFFASCLGTGDVYYFGEEVDIFHPDGSITHDGAWLAGVDGAMPGIIMPGTFLLGSRYFQELAPGVAMDRAEHVEVGIDLETEAGTFSDCARVLETSPLEPGAESEKIYCPGVGLAVDDEVELVAIGFRHHGQDDHEDED